REFDSETGLYFYRARFYDPNVGRFLSEDPIGLVDSSSVYTFVQNSPIDLTDPLGQLPKRKDKWYGHDDPDFQKWFHLCWKQPGDPDADKEGIEEAYREWVHRNKPRGGRCWNGPTNNAPKCNQKTTFEYQMEEESNRNKEK